jgi:hypothetical protein
MHNIQRHNIIQKENRYMSIESVQVSSFMTRTVLTQTEDQNIHAVSRTSK